jgi:hypothetical protein
VCNVLVAQYVLNVKYYAFGCDGWTAGSCRLFVTGASLTDECAVGRAYGQLPYMFRDKQEL